jgi:hypothetical protein
MSEKTNGKVGANAATKGTPVVVTKMDAVRKAMARLGWDTGRAQIRDYVKAHFGIEMTADHVSTCRADILRKKSAKPKASVAKTPPTKPTATTSSVVKAAIAKPTPTQPAPAPAQTKPIPAPAKVPGQVAKNGTLKVQGGITLQDILAVKELVGRVGSNDLKTLIDAFGR